jgi:hypothetical protein
MNDACHRIALLLLFASACASSNYRGIADTGGKSLAVVPVVERVPNVRVTEVRNSSGVLVGTEQTVTSYRNVTTGYRLELGEDVIDEQDFYHLARARDAEDAVASARAKGVLMNRVGIGILLGSLATAIAVPILTDRTMAKYSVGQAFITMPIGLGLTIFGKRRVERQNFSATHAFQAIAAEPPGWAAQLEGR